MLRLLVLLFALLNVALFFWVRSEPATLQADREPQRLQHQISPDAIQVLPDLPVRGQGGAASAAAGAGSSASDASTIVYPAIVPATELAVASAAAVGGASAPEAVAAGPNPAFVRPTSDVEVDCAESAALTDAQAATLRQALAKAGVASTAIAERREPAPASWMVYMGRYADADQWQKKADELRDLHVKFERVNTPASLAPGLSLGSYPSSAAANRELEALGRQGVHTARVVQAPASSPLRHLQVRSTSPGWRIAAGAQKFGACVAPAPAHAATTASTLTPAPAAAASSNV
jgi:hypothetical protein